MAAWTPRAGVPRKPVASMAPLFEHYGVQLWTPEVGGRVDFGADGHEQTMIAGLAVQAGDHPDQDPGPRRDSRAD